jgi:hypothetical protein
MIVNDEVVETAAGDTGMTPGLSGRQVFLIHIYSLLISSKMANVVCLKCLPLSYRQLIARAIYNYKVYKRFSNV